MSKSLSLGYARLATIPIFIAVMALFSQLTNGFLLGETVLLVLYFLTLTIWIPRLYGLKRAGKPATAAGLLGKVGLVALLSVAVLMALLTALYTIVLPMIGDSVPTAGERFVIYASGGGITILFIAVAVWSYRKLGAGTQ